MNLTLEYYDKNAEAFSADTIDVKFTEVQNTFEAYLPEGGSILDFGCGAGRDTRYFLEKGYQVEAIDGSEELCKIASRNTGIEIRHMMFSELEAVERYDGIWACSSILHLTRKELQDVIRKMIRAVKNGGAIYTSFKYGEFEGYRSGRYFTDFTEESFRMFIRDYSGIGIAEEWISADVRPGKEDEKWLNIILLKK